MTKSNMVAFQYHKDQMKHVYSKNRSTEKKVQNVILQAKRMIQFSIRRKENEQSSSIVVTRIFDVKCQREMLDHLRDFGGEK